MEVKVDFVDAEFRKAIKQYMKVTGKELPVVLNKVAVNLCFKAAKNQKAVRAATVKKHDPARKRSDNQRLLYKLDQKGISRRRGKNVARRISGSTRKERVKDEHSARQSSKGYFKAGFLALAAKGGAKTRKKPSRELMQNTRFIKATTLSPVVRLTHGAPNSASVASAAIVAAMPAAKADLIKFTNRKLAAISRKHSAR